MAFALKAGESVLIDDLLYRMVYRAASGDLVLREWENGNPLRISENELQRKYVKGNLAFGSLGALQARLAAKCRSSVPVENGGALVIPERNKDWKNENLILDFGSLRPEQQAEARRCKAYVDAILLKRKPSRRAQTWPAIIDAVARALPDARKPSWQTVSRWLRRYVASQCDIRALISGNASKGRHQAHRSPEERDVLYATLKLWLTEQQPTKQWVYDQVEAAYAKARRKTFGATDWKMPCRATVFRMLDRIDEYEKTRRREGKRAADYMFQTVGASKPATFRLEVVEIDHTRADVWVIDHATGYLLGRPWITIAIDRYTRMILGVYIGFESPSTHSVMQCLSNMIQPKIEFLEEMGLQGDWNPYGAPVALMFDNGPEFLSDSVADTLALLNITIKQQPVNRPEFKGIVERAMRTIKESGLTWMPGKVRTFAKDSRDYNPTKYAYITLDEFRQCFFRWLIFEYTNTTHTGIMDVPARRWAEEIAKLDVWVPNHVSDLKAVLGLRKKGIISRRGIRFRNLFYQSAELARIRRDPRYENTVQFTVDPGDLGCIRVTHPADQTSIIVPAAVPEYAKGLTLFQHDLIRAYLLKRNKSYENRADLVEGRRSLREWSLELLKKSSTKNRSRATKMAGIGVTQSKEKSPHDEASSQKLLRQESEPQRLQLGTDWDDSLRQIAKSDMEEEDSPTNPDFERTGYEASGEPARKSRKAKSRKSGAKASRGKTAPPSQPEEKSGVPTAPMANSNDDNSEEIDDLPIAERPTGRRYGPHDKN